MGIDASIGKHYPSENLVVYLPKGLPRKSAIREKKFEIVCVRHHVPTHKQRCGMRDFPTPQIKKIMQADEDVRKITTAMPLLATIAL
ncbi:hypothetical protein AAC387_Pa03g1190 [Persea americana]